MTGGERHTVAGCENGYYVRPAIVEMPSQTAVMLKETFAPILYVMKYRDFSEAIDANNAAAHGLSSCVFTTDVLEAERFLSDSGSDCGIANVNIRPSGAEIGSAFGGEKETGGGRESGADAWKAYMRRATNTVNYSAALPLAQGIDFSQACPRANRSPGRTPRSTRVTHSVLPDASGVERIKSVSTS